MRDDTAHLLDNSLHALASERFVQRAGALQEVTTQERPVHKGVPTDLLHDLCVQFIEALFLTSRLLERGMEAHEGECHRHEPLQIRCGIDEDASRQLGEQRST